MWKSFTIAFIVGLSLLFISSIAIGETCRTTEHGIAHFKTVPGTESEVISDLAFLKKWREFNESKTSSFKNMDEYDSMLIVITTDGGLFRSSLGSAQMLFYYFKDGCRLGKFSVSSFAMYQQFLRTYKNNAA